MLPEVKRRQERRKKAARLLNTSRYFGRPDSVLRAEDIFDAADKIGVPPYLFAAIVAVESAWGSADAAKWANNFTGVKGAGKELRVYADARYGLEAGALLLAKRYIAKGLLTPEQIGPIYAPTKGATNDAQGLNSNWVRNVRRIMDMAAAAAVA